MSKEKLIKKILKKEALKRYHGKRDKNKEV